MSTTIKIDIADRFDFSLIAIITSESIYRLSWLLNQELKTELKENKPLQIYHPKGKIVQEFERFSFYSETHQYQIQLVQNKGQNGFLAEDQSKVDFWLKFEPRREPLDTMVAEIKKIQNVSLAFEVNPGSIKSKDRFIFSFDEDC